MNLNERRYTAEISKGQGLIEETVALLRCWEPGMSVVDLKKEVRRRGVIDRATALRVEDIVGRIFALRYLSDGAHPAINLKLLLNLGMPVRQLNGIFFLYACRAHTILYDFVSEVYWGKYAAGATQISKSDALAFIEKAKNIGLISPPWSESTTARIARYLGTALADFGLASKDRRGIREIKDFRIDKTTSLYLAHDLHFRSISDNSVVEHPDWRLFGLAAPDVRIELERVSGRHLIIQSSGELTRISWQHKTIEEALRAVASEEI
jgi:hypothetical protein